MSTMLEWFGAIFLLLVKPLNLKEHTMSIAKIDPWEMQQLLMAASSQHLPATPELNKGVLLYAALNLEEGAETIAGLVSALGKLATTHPSGATLASIAEHLHVACTMMTERSLAVRAEIGSLPDDFRSVIEDDDLIEMADGATDLMVTNSGFSLALGIDGAACYDEVAGSNLSKRNPDTNVIDKTVDGKWIKGRAYRKPDLAKIVLAYKNKQ